MKKILDYLCVCLNKKIVFLCFICFHIIFKKSIFIFQIWNFIILYFYLFQYKIHILYWNKHKYKYNNTEIFKYQCSLISNVLILKWIFKIPHLSLRGDNPAKFWSNKLHKTPYPVSILPLSHLIAWPWCPWWTQHFDDSDQ